MRRAMTPRLTGKGSAKLSPQSGAAVHARTAGARVAGHGLPHKHKWNRGAHFYLTYKDFVHFARLEKFVIPGSEQHCDALSARL